MEFIIIIIIIFGIVEWIRESIKKRNERIKDNIAKEVLGDFDYNEEKNKILNKTDYYIKEKKKIIKNLNIEDMCPLCENKLQLRNGEYGKFWGCQSYPDCNFTKSFKI